MKTIKFLVILFIITNSFKCSKKYDEYTNEFILYMKEIQNHTIIKNSNYLIVNLDCIPCVDDKFYTKIYDVSKSKNLNLILLSGNQLENLELINNNTLFENIFTDYKKRHLRYNLGISKILVFSIDENLEIERKRFNYFNIDLINKSLKNY